LEEEPGTDEVTYSVVQEAEIGQYFDIELEEDEDGFLYDEDENLLGAVVHFETYPTHETLRSIFDDLLIKAVMQTQEVDEDEAQELIDECEDEDDFPDELDISDTFSVLFTVEGHQGLYRTLLDDNDYWTGHSTGRHADRWEV